MSLLDFLTTLPQNSTVERAIKTFVEATAAQAALYTTVVPNSPGVKTSAAVSGGATVLSVVWNLLLTWVGKAKAAKLAAFAAAVDQAVSAQLAVREALAQPPGTVVATPIVPAHAPTP